MKNPLPGLVIHCSDSSFGSATLIKSWHTDPKPKGRAWRDIGYHVVICNGFVENNTYIDFMDGAIEWGRDIDEDGAHTFGFNDLPGLCLIGESGKFTIAQLEATRRVILYFIEHHGLDPETIKMHSDLDDRKPYCAGIKEFKKFVQKCINFESLDEFVGKVNPEME